MEPIYMDYNATTPIAPQVLEAMMPYLTEHFGNPSSSHRAGIKAREAVEEARAQVAALIGARPHEIVFTSGGTEANNLAIFGSIPRSPCAPRDALFTSAIEHPASMRPMRALEEQGYVLRIAGVDGNCQLDRAALDLLDERVAIASVMHANNEVGVLQPIEALAQRASAAGALLHVDGAQAAGKIPVDVTALGVDLYTIVGHKLYAPKGVGALYVREGVELAPQSHGAGHERGLRAGTENVPGVVGLGAASALAMARLDEESSRLGALRDELARRLQEGIPGLVTNGEDAPRLPQTLHVSVPNLIGFDILSRAQIVMASTGAACRAPTDPPSATLTSMGLEPHIARGALRLSLGHGTSQRDVERASAAIIAAASSLIS